MGLFVLEGDYLFNESRGRPGLFHPNIDVTYVLFFHFCC